MPHKFQFNKTALQQIRKQLEIRESALPTLKNKETALRIEVKKAEEEKERTLESIVTLEKKYKSLMPFWEEFNINLPIDEVIVKQRNIAGVKVPQLQQITFKETDISLFASPIWIPAGITFLKERLQLEISLKLAKVQSEILMLARKKTTQKVNLYEKVQIPNFQKAIIRIKRFLEDKENISKAAQKMIKQRNQLEEVL
jgi:V/A-type H+-transporting ATPase subunit D